MLAEGDTGQPLTDRIVRDGDALFFFNFRADRMRQIVRAFTEEGFDGFDVRAQVVGLVAHHLKPGMLRKAPHVGDGAFRRLAQKVDLELLARLARADCLGRTGDFDCSAMDWFIERARALGVAHQPPKPLLLGRHVLALGVPPGPRVGEILKAVYERQLDGDIRSVEDGIEAARAILARGTPAPPPHP